LRVTVVLLGSGTGPKLSAAVETIRSGSREEGWAKAQGEVVAFFDTRYAAGEEWEAALSGADTVGGYVWPGEGYGWAAWIYYVVEYGWARRLAAGNVAYRRVAVKGIDPLVPGEGLHDRRMDVRLARTPEFGEYLRERYAYSWKWGARNVRPVAALLRVFLPLLVLARVPWWKRPLTLPGVMVVSLVMAWGEAMGSLNGKVNS
jgi:hypothetical protein